MRQGKMIERRLHKRYTVKEGAFVVHSGHIGQILDISLGGFMCQCVGNIYIAEEPAACDIFCAHSACKFKIKELTVRRVTKSVNPLSPWTTTLVKRCGLQFSDLTSQQATHLQNFINFLSAI